MGLKESIGWAERTLNIYTGCRNKACPMYDDNCYAQRMARRLAGRFGYPLADPFRPIFHQDRLERPCSWRKPCVVFVGSMGELGFVSEENFRRVLKMVGDNPRHRFLFLTKMPEALLKYTWPPNAWVGCSALDQEMAERAIFHLAQVEAAVRFLSCEPLRGQIALPRRAPVEWLIIGAESLPGGGTKQPHPAWVGVLLNWADRTKTPVFMKGNLTWPNAYARYPKRREWPPLLQPGSVEQEQAVGQLVLL